MRLDINLRLTQGRFDLDLQLEVEARVLAFYGPSGSGKTTTLEVLAGLRRANAGRLVLDGDVLFDAERGVHRPPRERRLGYVSQDVLLFPHMDVRRNIEYGRRSGADRFAALDEMLDLAVLLDRDVSSLSGGERQRVALARALNASPRLLLLDEPLAAVDLRRRRRIVEALARVRDDLAVPIVYVAHAVEEVRALADQVVLMDEGRVVGYGPPGDVLG